MRLTQCFNNKYLSKIFLPNVAVCKPNNSKTSEKSQVLNSKSQKLLLETGLVRPTSGSGLFVMLPMMMKSLNRLCSIISNCLEEVGAQKIAAPCLAPSYLWKKTGRLSSNEEEIPEIIKVNDRHNKSYVLCPTHEETLTDLISNISPVSTKQLPLKLYQIGPKFRDEMRPRFGIIRAREFIMKDLYTFDVDKSAAMETYKQISDAYDKIFNIIGLPFIKVEGDNGLMGGSASHEYQYKCNIGEDQVLECKKCEYRITEELFNNRENVSCDRCQNNIEEFNKYSGLEVGHTFLLGDRYSSILGAKSTSGEALQMCCFGLGVTRIIGAALEAQCTETELKWPLNLAPYKVCIIGPKSGSKESVADSLVEELYQKLSQTCLKDEDILIDDRNTFTIGKRLLEAKKVGYPFIIVVGKKAMSENPEFELITDKNDTLILNIDNIINRLKSVMP